MGVTPPPTRAVQRTASGLLLFAFATRLFTCEASAQTAATPPAVPMQVLERREVRVGDRSIIYNRVVPPVLPKTGRPVPTAPAIDPENAAAKVQSPKRQEVLFLSAIVHAGPVTELRWFEAGREHRAFSNIDFRHFGATAEVESAEAAWLLLLSVSEAPRPQEEPADSSQPKKALTPVPSRERFSASRSEYLLADSGSAAPPSPATLAALDALHLHYDARGEELLLRHSQREAERAKEAGRAKENPPPPKQTIINFWPVRSRAHPATGKTEGAR